MYVCVCMCVCVYVCMYVWVHEVYDNLRRSSDRVLDDWQQGVVPVLIPCGCVRTFQFNVLLCMLGFSLAMFK